MQPVSLYQWSLFCYHGVASVTGAGAILLDRLVRKQPLLRDTTTTEGDFTSSITDGELTDTAGDVTALPKPGVPSPVMVAVRFADGSVDVVNKALGFLAAVRKRTEKRPTTGL